VVFDEQGCWSFEFQLQQLQVIWISALAVAGHLGFNFSSCRSFGFQLQQLQVIWISTSAVLAIWISTSAVADHLDFNFSSCRSFGFQLQQLQIISPLLSLIHEVNHARAQEFHFADFIQLNFFQVPNTCCLPFALVIRVQQLFFPTAIFL
jgi:hypothetical protein